MHHDYFEDNWRQTYIQSKINLSYCTCNTHLCEAKEQEIHQ